jgi:UDP-N-acetylglucosamine transferase subunit ALG13
LNDNIINGKIQFRRKKLLVAPLDWGLGHAARCIPLIRNLLLLENEVIIAGSGDSLHLLQKVFPDLKFLNIPGYGIHYGIDRRRTLMKISLQLPKILIRINQENSWLKRLIRDEKIEGLISDNRFGLYSSSIPCIFMTHQLAIQSGLGKIADSFLQRVNYRFINRFSQCWVPDQNSGLDLGGALSHPIRFPKIPVHYIGWLSRFEKKKTNTNGKVLILLSGPEPQRTLLENIMLSEAGSFAEKLILVRGLPGRSREFPEIKGLETYDHLPEDRLNELIAGAELLICRPGYSTLMDLAIIGKSALVVVPTPGQQEQEYLGDYLSERGILIKMEQSVFSIANALEKARNFSFKPFPERVL